MLIKHDGGCLCGRIRFEALGEPMSVSHCHCVFCRRQTGAAFATFAAFQVPDRFRWVTGTPAVYRSSPSVRRKFCKRCGTPLTFEEDRFPAEMDIAISAFDEPGRFPPRYHTFTDQRIAWVHIADGLPSIPGSADRPASPGSL